MISGLGNKGKREFEIWKWNEIHEDELNEIYAVGHLLFNSK